MQRLAKSALAGMALLLLSQGARPQEQNQIDCLAEALYFESRGEGLHGMVAIAIVIQNRVASPHFPNTVCEVVHQGSRSNKPTPGVCQFSYYCDGLAERITEQKSWTQAQRIAEAVINSSVSIDPLGDATHYHAVGCVPSWAKSLTFLGRLERHKFYVE